MDHIVYLDAKANELEKALSGNKTMLIRGAAGRKMPYGRVNIGDMLYLVENDGSGLIKAKARVSFVLNSDKMDQEESKSLVDHYQDQLTLTPQQYKRWAGKRYLILVALSEIEALEPFSFDKSEFTNMDDWLPVVDISRVTGF